MSIKVCLLQFFSVKIRDVSFFFCNFSEHSARSIDAFWIRFFDIHCLRSSVFVLFELFLSSPMTVSVSSITCIPYLSYLRSIICYPFHPDMRSRPQLKTNSYARSRASFHLPKRALSSASLITTLHSCSISAYQSILSLNVIWFIQNMNESSWEIVPLSVTHCVRAHPRVGSLLQVHNVVLDISFKAHYVVDLHNENLCHQFMSMSLSIQNFCLYNANYWLPWRSVCVRVDRYYWSDDESFISRYSPSRE